MQEPPTKVLTPHAPAGGPSGSNGTVDPPAKPKLKKLRLAVILGGLGALALVSTVFGMMMAVSSDLPQLENRAEYQRSKNSVVVAGDISPNIKNAVIAIEDRRFYQHEGVDYKGIARAFVQDVRQKRAAQGGSTITQQFVKNALTAQTDRSVFQKLREAALAYHLEREWSKQKVLTQYLNSVYFGNGAYGVEAAVRTYFGGNNGDEEPGTDRRIHARSVSVAQGALLAGMIASPS